MTLRDEKPAHTPGGALPGPEVESLGRNGGDAPAVTTTAAGSAPSAGERQPGETLDKGALRAQRKASAECQHTHPESERLGYLAWHAWADRMSETHRQKRCPGCGLFKLWVRL